jgi:hypothetical protein
MSARRNVTCRPTGDQVRPVVRAVIALSAGLGLVLALVVGAPAGLALTRSPAAGPEATAAPAVTTVGWPQLHYGADRTGLQPSETVIGTGTVGRLALSATYSSRSGGMSAPLIANGVLYTDVAGFLTAFDAAGITDCSAAPSNCTPLWSAATAGFDGMTTANGVVFVTDAEGVQAFDAAGVTGCSGTPKTCTPLWATSTHTNTGPSFLPDGGSPLVSNGLLYVPGYGDGLSLPTGGAYVSVFDAAGSTNCTGTPKVCTPIWTTTGLPSSAGDVGSPTIANGVLYLANGTLFAFDAAGSTNCTGTPKVCSPLWTAATASGPTYAAPAVANGTVYVGSWSAKLFAFDAAGVKNCTGTTTKTCTPLWTAATSASVGGTPAVGYGSVYTVSTDGTLGVFDAAGVTNCTGTTTKTCTPLWSSGPGGTGYVTSSAPALANGVVYFSSTDGGTYAYEAAGSLKCTASGATKKCTPLWSAVSGFMGGGSPAVANGVVYVNLTSISALYAYSPAASAPAAPTAVKAVSGSTTTTTGAVSVTFTLGANNGSAITAQTARCTSSNGGVAASGTHTGATAAAITVAGLTTGKSYTCTVTATNARGVGLASAASAAVIVGAPAAPTAVAAVRVAAGQLKVSFTAGANNGSAITSYTARCTSTNGGVTSSKAAAVSPITVVGLTGAKTYTCTVTATNARGAGPASVASAAVTA